MKIILLYGLTATGKSVFCNYVANKYNYRVIQIRRLFESVVGKDKAPEVYHKLLEITKCKVKDFSEVSCKKVKSVVYGVSEGEEVAITSISSRKIASSSGFV